ncbi:DUF1704 domain-containing protein [Candidatus Saccharibacteria bacterium]|nr:DUF1704 domain-containing protein [Candidatus Saccharibacteria bacterium]
MSEFSTVVVLKPITPTVESARGGRLQYANLASAVDKHYGTDMARLNAFWDLPEGSLEEEAAAQQLANLYLLQTARRATETIREDHPDDQAQAAIWAERYTQASSEIYGVPEAEIASRLAAEQAIGLQRLAGEAGADDALRTHYAELNERYGLYDDTVESAEALFAEVAETVGTHMMSKYEKAFAALDLEGGEDQIGPADIADKIENAIQALADHDDPDWSGWTVERNDDKDSLSVVAADKKIIVGMKRASVTATQLKGLLGHEVLVHAKRGVNGSKVNYVDISLALGTLGNKPLTRPELLEFAMTRALLRNEIEEKKKPVEQIESEVYAHVNRIYRGTRGDQYSGVFTKDISYHQGFIKMGQFITERLEGGDSVDDIMDYLLLGKFDPTNERHLAKLKELEVA